jgi:hypothetical protein
MQSTKQLKVAIFILLLVVITVFTGCGRTTPSENNFYGFWVNEDTDTQSITKVDIDKVGEIILVHIWGKFHPTDCDWGIETTDISDASDGTLNIVWDQGFAIRTQELILLSDGRLKVITFTDYYPDDIYGREDYESTEYFIKEY